MTIDMCIYEGRKIDENYRITYYCKKSTKDPDEIHNNMLCILCKDFKSVTLASSKDLEEFDDEY